MPLGFLVPLFLAGLAAVAIPIWVHLTRKQRSLVVPFPSLMFLQQVPFKEDRRRTLHHWLLLALRALVIVLLGGLHSLAGPVVGALAYHGLSTELTRATEHWRLILGVAIVVLVVAFPEGIVGFAQRRFGRRGR